METNSSSSLPAKAAPNDFNEGLPDPIPETHPRDLGSSGIFYDIEPDFDIPDIQTRAIELTIQGHNDSQVAQLLRINRRTLWTWKNQNPTYQQALSSARTHAHAGIIDRYRNLFLSRRGHHRPTPRAPQRRQTPTRRPRPPKHGRLLQTPATHPSRPQTPKLFPSPGTL